MGAWRTSRCLTSMRLGPFPARAMKDDLFAQVYDFENLHAAYRRARAGKRYKPEVLAFDERQEENLLALRDELRSGAYRHGPYRHFIVNDSKKRSIMAAPFRDRVMHHALCAVIAPVFERGFIYDSYACRRGKGTHAAVARMRSFVRGAGYREAYILKCDISKYFASIDHDVLYALIEKKIRDERVLALVRAIIESAGEGGAGIPIGNLTSQLFANIYLNELDQFAKHELRIRRYIRYMDDFAVVDTDKRRLAAYRERIAGFVSARLKLSLHPKKSTIAPARLGVDFLGYRLFERRTRLRASTVRRFVKRTRSLLCGLEKMRGGGASQEEVDAAKRHLAESLASWSAYARHADSFRLRESLFRRLGLGRVFE